MSGSLLLDESFGCDTEQVEFDQVKFDQCH